MLILLFCFVIVFELYNLVLVGAMYLHLCCMDIIDKIYIKWDWDIMHVEECETVRVLVVLSEVFKYTYLPYKELST